jgi:hypothetical protein
LIDILSEEPIICMGLVNKNKSLAKLDSAERHHTIDYASCHLHYLLLMIVNDEANLVILLERILSREGYQVTAVHGFSYWRGPLCFLPQKKLQQAELKVSPSAPRLTHRAIDLLEDGETLGAVGKVFN